MPRGSRWTSRASEPAGRGRRPRRCSPAGGTSPASRTRSTSREEVERLREEILNLKDQERLVLSLYYFEELKLHEIASILGVTESRVSQIRSKAVVNLRARLGGLRDGVCA